MSTRQRLLRMLNILAQSTVVLATLLTIFASLVSGTVVLSIIRANGSLILIVLVAVGSGVVLSLLMVLSISFINERAARRRDEAAQAEKRISEIDQVNLQPSLIEVSMRIELLQKQIEELVGEKERLEEQTKFAREQLEEEKRRHFLEKQEQSIEWQKEAIALVDISPRAAIIIAWIAIDKELQQLIRRLEITKFPFFFSPLDNIKYLRAYNVIDQDTGNALLAINKYRNQIVHGVSEEEVTKDRAITFVQQAIDIAEKLSSIETSAISE